MKLEQFIEKYQKEPVEEYPNRVLDVVGQPVVSVRVSTYNHAPYLRQCLDSILAQEMAQPWEVCIGEDESSDGTREICIEYAKAHPERIRLFLHKRVNNISINGRPSSKFQSAYTRMMCRGNYNTVCEGDDFWIDSTKLQTQFDYMEAHPEFIMCATRCLHWNTLSPRNSKINPPLALGTFASFRDLLTLKIHPHTSTYLCRREFYDLIPDELLVVIQGDLTRVLLAGEYSGGIPVLENITSVYRISTAGSMQGVPAAVRLKSMASFWRNYEKYSAKRHSFRNRQIIRRHRIYHQSALDSWQWDCGPLERKFKLFLILLFKCPLYLIRILRMSRS